VSGVPEVVFRGGIMVGGGSRCPPEDQPIFMLGHGWDLEWSDGEGNCLEQEEGNEDLARQHLLDESRALKGAGFRKGDTVEIIVRKVPK